MKRATIAPNSQDEVDGMTSVSLLGLGIMGSGIARNILKAGFPLTVYNRTTD